MISDVMKEQNEEAKRSGSLGKEEDRQVRRKNQIQVSRFLDNYFHPLLHKKSWWPNGAYVVKKPYGHCDSGLTYYFEKNNILQRREISEKDKLKKTTQDFLEYDFVEDNNFIVTIEYCANCEQHQSHTRHSSELYKNFAISLQKCILMRFPFIGVLLKPIETDIIKDIAMTDDKALKKSKVIDDKFKEVRIGAMEIQLCYKKPSEKTRTVQLLHSKLKTGMWPSIANLLNSIVSFIPRVDCEVHLFEKESNEEENKEKNENEEILESYKLQNIQLNFYQFKNQKCEELSERCKEDIENVNDPKKRKVMILSSRQKEKESFYKPGTQTQTFSKNHTTNTFTLQKSSNTNFYSTNSNINSTSTFKEEGNFIKEKEIIDSCKGEKILTLFSDKKGHFKLKDIPCDSYLIEIVESKNYQGMGMILNFIKIPNDMMSVKKYLGLSKQLNAFLQVHLMNFIKKEKIDELDVDHVPDCEVTLKICPESDNQIIFDEKECKIKLEEKKVGIFEHMMTPGRYLLEVNKKGYEPTRKHLVLVPGVNTVNVEMIPDRIYKVKVNVYNYEKYEKDEYESVANASVNIYKSSQDCIYEGITDNKGELSYEVNKEDDYLTFVVSKASFFPCQRMYIRNTSEERESNYCDTVVIMLVKESFLTKNNSIIIITYSNLFKENFQPYFQFSEKIKNSTEVSCFDSQAQNGILTTCIKYHTPAENERQELQDEEELEEIVRLTLPINEEKLRKHNYQLDSHKMNGLEKFCCQSIVYTQTNVFFIQPPSFHQENYQFWDMGWLDIKNNLFYEVSLLTKECPEKNKMFFDWTNFLQEIIDKKIFSKLFEFFGFDKGLLTQYDRQLYEPSFFKILKTLSVKENLEFFIQVCDMMKTGNKMISYAIFKKKITSNLKNFKDNLKVTTFK